MNQNKSYSDGTVYRKGIRDDLGQFKPLGLFDAKIVSRSEQPNSKGRYFYYISFDVNYSSTNHKTKKCLVTSEHYFEPGEIVAVDLINWRDQNTKQYSLFLVIVPPEDQAAPDENIA